MICTVRHVRDEPGTNTTILFSHSINDLWLGRYLNPVHLSTQRAYWIELSGQLDSLKDGTLTSDVIEIVAAELARLRKEYADAIAYLPSYDQRQIDKASQPTHTPSETTLSVF